LFTALPLRLSGQTINLFSLAGLCIAIGEIADATIVHVENCAAELSIRKNLTVEQRRDIVIHSITSLAKPLTFSLLIILASFLPVFFLEDREARLFDPLAYSKTFAMAFSTVFTLFLLPIVTVWIFERRTLQNRFAIGERLPLSLPPMLLLAAWRFRTTVAEFLPEIIELGIVLIPVFILWIVRKRRRTTHSYQDSRMVPLLPVGVGIHDSPSICVYRCGSVNSDSSTAALTNFQRDFLPETDEGSILYMPSTLPGLPTREAGWVLQQMDKKLKEFPEVDRVFGKLGRADTSTDPAPVSMVETTILLKPRSEWRKGNDEIQTRCCNGSRVGHHWLREYLGFSRFAHG
jgi:Cu(I)/Ag(I) efflux system membrane protein CusA/SilA